MFNYINKAPFSMQKGALIVRRIGMTKPPVKLGVSKNS